MLGSRLKGGGSAIEQGMPWWKYVANRFLTGVENLAFGLHLSEYHTGYRAFSRDVLEAVNFRMNSDGFVFDQEIIAQVVAARLPHRGDRRCPCATSRRPPRPSFRASCGYGLKILWVVARYLLHRSGLKRSRRLRPCAGGTAASGRPGSPAGRRR